jgi:phosphatidylinositol alpha-1,6-mannosyltransferase
VCQALADHRCDRVVFGAAAPLGLLARRLREAGARQLVGLTHGHEVWWARLPGSRRLLRRIGDDTDALTYVSEFCRAAVAAALRPDAAAAMIRLSPGVDTTRFRPGLDGASWRHRWGVGPGRPVVLSASRMVRRKGHDRLLDAWPDVLAAQPDAVLVVMGDGPMRRALDRRVRRRGLGESVRLVPGVPWTEMPRVYAAADVFALPCRTRRLGLEPEALGIVFLEAAATGLPVVAGASGGAPEAVRDGESGHVVDPRDPAAIARAVVALLSDSVAAAAMGRRGRAWVEGSYSLAVSQERLRALLGLSASAGRGRVV